MFRKIDDRKEEDNPRHQSNVKQTNATDFGGMNYPSASFAVANAQTNSLVGMAIICFSGKVLEKDILLFSSAVHMR